MKVAGADSKQIKRHGFHVVGSWSRQKNNRC